MTEENNILLEYRVTNLEAVVVDVRNSVRSIDASLKSLTRLEDNHAQTRETMSRVFEALEDHNKRIRTIENELPILKLIRNWVISGVIGAVSLAAVSVYNTIDMDHRYRTKSQSVIDR